MKNLISKEEKGSIASLCKQYEIYNYSINSDGSIDVDGDVNLKNRHLTGMPLHFGKVSGDFYCCFNQMTSLLGGPVSVGGNYNCYDNQLTSLLGSPVTIDGSYNCGGNRLSSLVGSPVSIGGDYNCSYNHMSTLLGGPVSVGGDYNCYENILTTLVDGPVSVGGSYNCFNNILSTLEGLPHIIGKDFFAHNNSLVSTYSGDTDIELVGDFYIDSDISNRNLPQLMLGNSKHIKLIMKYQRHFEIWNNNMSLNEENFQMLIEEIEEGLQ